MKGTIEVLGGSVTGRPGRHRAPGPPRTDAGVFSNLALAVLTTATVMWVLL